VSFRCDPATVARLEWPRLLVCLAAQAATARGAEALRAAVFPATHGSVRERLAETSEARALVDAGAAPGFGGIADLRAELADVSRGRTLGAAELAKLLAMLDAARRIAGAFAGNAQRAPRLAALAETLPDLRELERALAR
jgi:dsDNA-specific endonuclease/ATPase MutS2